MGEGGELATSGSDPRSQSNRAMLEKTQEKKHGACFVAMVTKQHAFFGQVTSEARTSSSAEALQRLFWLSNQIRAVCVCV